MTTKSSPETVSSQGEKKLEMALEMPMKKSGNKLKIITASIVTVGIFIFLSILVPLIFCCFLFFFVFDIVIVNKNSSYVKWPVLRLEVLGL